MTRMTRGTRLAVHTLMIFAIAAITLIVTALPSRADTLLPVTGSGSTYVGIAMRQWVAEGQAQGLSINYTPTGSPTGMSLYAQSQVDFAGTEAEFQSLSAPNPPRGFQYVPDVAGATAIMYNVKESSGTQVDYLHLDRQTVARIFIGQITRWSDPAISATNKNIVFPDQPIRVVLRGSPSGTTALFYDFIASTLGAEYANKYVAFGCGNAQIRPVQIQCQKPGFIPSFVSFNDSDQIAQYVGSPGGQWSIGFDEFGYAKVHKVPTAWIRNTSGAYVLPYAQNISAALESAKLRPDLSQELAGVYASGNPQAYPISAYSYLVTQCGTSADRPSCTGSYPNAGQSGTLAKWMSYIACSGQISMAAQGYSPLPPNLSQEMANSVARLSGTPAVTLTKDNCANPRFAGSLGAGATSPCDPFDSACKAPGSSSGGGPAAGSTTPGGSPAGKAPAASAPRPGPGAGSGPGSGSGSGGAAAPGGAAGSGGSGGVSGSPTSGNTAAGPGASGASGGVDQTAGAAGSSAAATQGSADGRVLAVGGGSDAASWKKADPTQFTAAVPADPFGWLPAALLALVVLVPVLVTSLGSRRGTTRR